MSGDARALAVALAGLWIAASAGAAPVDGRNAALAQYGSGGKFLGEFRQVGAEAWHEDSRHNGLSFDFVETHRDDWSVYLHDPSRDVRIQIDLHTRKIYLSDAQTPEPRPIYDVLYAEAGRAAPTPSPQATGRNLRSARFGHGSRVLGEYRHQGGPRWQEAPADPAGSYFVFEETGRDDWSVYLHDASRGARIQIDLHTRKIYYSDAGSPRRELYDVIDATPHPPEGAACEARGGVWRPFGLAGSWRCNMPTRDAGRSCRDSDECQSVCVAPGRCHGWTVTLGSCLAHVEDGVVQPELCAD